MKRSAKESWHYFKEKAIEVKTSSKGLRFTSTVEKEGYQYTCSITLSGPDRTIPKQLNKYKKELKHCSNGAELDVAWETIDCIEKGLGLKEA
jgi:hypothetical protein